jgi:hypothetical protein
MDDPKNGRFLEASISGCHPGQTFATDAVADV